MAKKKRRKAAPDVDPNERRRERLEARRRQKAEAEAARRRAAQRERLVRMVLMLGLLAGAIWFFFLRGALPSEIGGHEIEDLSVAGANQHSTTLPDYPSDPPVSGEHAPNPYACGIHSQAIPDGGFVHTLEHGAVAIVYQPTLDAGEIERIESIVASYDSHVLSAPNEQMDSPIAVAAWAHLMRLDELDEDAIREFIDVFSQGGDAPEANQDCPNTSDVPFNPNATPRPTLTLPPASPAADHTHPPGTEEHTHGPGEERRRNRG